MIKIKLSWEDFKVNVTNRSLEPQWFVKDDGYYIHSFDKNINFHTDIDIEVVTEESAKQLDFEANYKDIWNTPLNSLPDTVKTQKELGIITTKMACLVGVLDSTGCIEMDLTVPSGGRSVSGGACWFDVFDSSSKIMVEVHHPTMGMVDAYCDTDVPMANKGWYVEPDGTVRVQAMDFFGQLPEGMILKIKAVHGAGAASFGTAVRCNIQWGKISE